ncbi:MAG: preprotein translocase subunit SecG [Candidatus Saccharimonadales bacterium]
MIISDILPLVTIVSALLMVACILLQARGASLGAGFGSSGELFTTRRGIDKSLFDVTVVLTVVFILSILANLMLAAG